MVKLKKKNGKVSKTFKRKYNEVWENFELGNFEIQEY